MLRYIEYLLAVYEKKSFSRAAKSLYISQPALSSVVKKVEAELGAPIFDRTSSPLRLTEAGEYYIRSVKKIQEIESDIRNFFAQYSQTDQDTIVIGAASYFCTYILPDYIAEFESCHPGVQVSVFEANTDDLNHCMKNRIIDVCINVDNMKSDMLSVRPWMTEHIILAVPAAYEVNKELKPFQLCWEDIVSGTCWFDDTPSISLKKFSAQPYLFLKERNDIYERAHHMCQNAGFRPKIVMYLDQLLTSYYIAREGHGLCFIRAEMLSYLKKTDRLVFYKIDDPLTVRDVYIYSHNGKHNNSYEDALIRFLTKGPEEAKDGLRG